MQVLVEPISPLGLRLVMEPPVSFDRRATNGNPQLFRCGVALMCYSERVFLSLVTAMPTTTIRLPEDLKSRVAEAAKRSGMTTHGFILEAIVEKTEQEKQRADFDAVAEGRFARILASGKTIPWQEMRGYLEQRLAGKDVKRPVARKHVR